jgi:hypothetical protein
MQKALRVILGIGIVGLVLRGADLATRDCRLAPYVYDDCMWVNIRRHLGLPASRFLRMGVLECVGIGLALILYLTFRYVFPVGKTVSPVPDSTTHFVPEPPKN